MAHHDEMMPETSRLILIDWFFMSDALLDSQGHNKVPCRLIEMDVEFVV